MALALFQPSSAVLLNGGQPLAGQEIVFIDPSVTDAALLMGGVRSGVEAVLLAPMQDGVQQISRALAQRQNLKAIHIVTHGRPGQVRFSTVDLSLDTVDWYAEEVRGWAAALAPDAALLIYGCEVAQGAMGEQFVQRLSELTGANVAASATKTGCAALGADWELDFTPLAMQSSLAFLPEVIENYPAVFGNEFRVNSNSSIGFEQRYSSVTALNDGGFVVTWSSYNQDGSYWGIYGQRYNASGAAVGAEFRINSFTPYEQLYSSVTALSDGGFVVTWSSVSQDGSGWGIYGQRYDASGASVGTEFRINSFIPSDQVYSSVTALNDGSFVVTWSSLGQDGSGYGIYGQRYNASGASVGGEFRINSYPYDSQLYSSVTALNDGGFVVTWSSAGQDGSYWGIYGQRYNASGASVGAEFRINSYTYDNQLYSSVTALNDGGFVVTWSSLGQDGRGYGIYGQRYNASGASVGAEFRINSYAYDNQLYSSATALNDGGFVVTWSSWGQEGSNWGVYGQQFNSQGNKVGSEFQINQFTSGDQFTESFANGGQSITALNNGDIVVTWQGSSTTDSYGINARILTLPPSNTPPSLAVPSPISITETAGDDTFSSVTGTLSATDPNGQPLTYGINGVASGTTLVQSLIVDSRQNVALAGQPRVFSAPLQAGQLYRIVVSGEWQPANSYAPNLTVDARFITSNSGGQAPTDFDITYYPGYDFGLYSTALGNNDDRWGAYSPSHVYSTVVLGYGAPIDFFFQDGNPSDNSGALQVEIYAIQPVTQTGQYGTLVLNPATGAYTYTPNDSAIEALTNNTSESFTITVSDGLGGTATQTLAINITGVNDTPILTAAIADQPATQNSPFSFTLPANTFSDVDAEDVLTYTATLADGSVLPTWLVFDAATLTFSGTPANADVGNIAVKVTATDLAGASASTTFSLAIANVNDAPIGTATATLTPGTEDQPSLINTADLLVGFSDVEVDTLAIADLSADTGTLVNNGNGTYTLTPAANFNGPITLSYSVVDGNGGSVAATQTVEIANVNDAPSLDPTFVPELTAIAEDTLDAAGNTVADIVVNGSITDIDVAGVAPEAIAISAVDSTHGTWQYQLSGGTWTTIDFAGANAGKGLLLDETARLRFIPNADYSGTATFSFRAWDQTLGSSGSYFALGAGAGTLDTSFGTSGIATADFTNGMDIANAIAIQADGKTIVAGYVHPSGSYRSSALARFNSNGSLDTSFGTNGKANIDLAPFANDQIQKVHTLSDGSILVTGTAYAGSGFNFAVAKLTAAGNLDTSFDGDGKVVTALGNNSYIYDSAVLGDGKLVAVGDLQNEGFAVVRYNSDGSLDTSFSDDGVATTTLASGFDSARSVTPTADGKLLVAGFYNGPNGQTLGLARFNSDGSLDTSFDGDGKLLVGDRVFVDDELSSIRVTALADGKFLVGATAGYSNGFQATLYRYNGNGSLDSTFGTAGKQRLAINDLTYLYLNDLQVAADGKIVLGLSANNGSPSQPNFDFATVRLNANGSLDTSFGTNGITTVPISSLSSSALDFARGIQISADGDILLGGYSYQTAVFNGDRQFALVRLNGDTVQTAFSEQSDTAGLTIAPVNDAPGLDLNGAAVGINATATFSEDSAPVAIVSNGLTLTDGDSPTLASATVTITNLLDGEAESLVVPSTFGYMAATYSTSTGTLMLVGSATLAQYQEVLRTIAYRNSSQNPDPTPRTISFVVNDGETESAIATSTVTVIPINDAPIGTATATLADGLEDTPYSLSTAELLAGFSDVDGDTLAITDLSATNGSLIDQGNGIYTFTPNADFNGTVALTYAVVDGNGGSVAASQSFTLIDTPDIAPPLLSLTVDSGSSNTDLITNSKVVNVSGLEPNSTWQYSLNNGTTWVNGQGTSFSVSGDGVKSVITRQTVGGNTSLNSDPFIFTLDTKVSAPGLSLATDSGRSTSDKITTTGIVNVSRLEAGATWQYSTDAGTSWVEGVGTSFALTEDGLKSAIVRQTDLAGNTSASSAAFNFTLDTTGPIAPTLVLATDSGSASDDGITKSGSINVLGLEANATWQYSTNGGTTWITGRGTSFTLTGNGTKTVIARQTDIAGNRSESSNPLVFTLDTTVATPTLALAVDSGRSTSDKITTTGIVNVSRLEAGATWQYSTDAGTSWVEGVGTSFGLTEDGLKSAIVRQTDLAGNTSASSAALNFTLDTTGPVAPTLALATDSGSSSDDGITKSGVVNVLGLEANATWQYSTNGGTTWITGKGTSFILTGSGAKAVTARQFDAAGNASEMSAFGFTLDAIAPTRPTLTFAATGQYGESDAFILAGTAEANSTVNLYSGLPTGTVIATALADSTGQWSTTWTSDITGLVAFNATATDIAGNTGAAVSLTVDIQPGTADDDTVLVATSTTPRYLSGQGGNDSLNGGAGKDFLFGGDGDDLLVGSGGKDSLTGGSGGDTFRYTALNQSLLASFDHITDLAIGEDGLDGPYASSAANVFRAGAVSALTQEAIGAVLTSGAFKAKGAATFTLSTGTDERTFVALNDTTSGFSASRDAIIEITGYSGDLNALAIL